MRPIDENQEPEKKRPKKDDGQSLDSSTTGPPPQPLQQQLLLPVPFFPPPPPPPPPHSLPQQSNSSNFTGAVGAVTSLNAGRSEVEQLPICTPLSTRRMLPPASEPGTITTATADVAPAASAAQQGGVAVTSLPARGRDPHYSNGDGHCHDVLVGDLWLVSGLFTPANGTVPAPPRAASTTATSTSRDSSATPIILTWHDLSNAQRRAFRDSQPVPSYIDVWRQLAETGEGLVRMHERWTLADLTDYEREVIWAWLRSSEISNPHIAMNKAATGHCRISAVVGLRLGGLRLGCLQNLGGLRLGGLQKLGGLQNLGVGARGAFARSADHVIVQHL